jgi:hypothetical protein
LQQLWARKLADNGMVIWKKNFSPGVHAIDLFSGQGIYLLTDGVQSEKLMVQ